MAKHRSVMNHDFSRVPNAEIPRSSFDRSSTLKTTCYGGQIVPVFVDEILPGDTFNLRASFFGRLATPLKPFLDTLIMDTFFFFVPNRLVWDNWEKFMGAQDNPGDSTNFVIPQLSTYTFAIGSTADHFGLPVTGGPLANVNALPFRGNNLIYNEWFRDQNLQDSISVPTGDGPDNPGGNDYLQLRRRGKRHDYFTSALPWPQKGDAVTVDLLGRAPIEHDGAAGSNLNVYSTAQGYETAIVSSTARATLGSVDSTGGDNLLYANLSEATGFTINDLRQSFQIQKLLERDARGGTRYPELIRSHFGVTSPDARLQRPEFLGGGSKMISVNPVAQTAAETPTGTTTPQGNLAAFGTVSAQGHGFTKSFVEHGYVFGYVNFRADLTYQQGLHRLWSRSSRYDFYFPALSHLGEQPIYNQEIFYQNDPADLGVFGYQERNAEYRYRNSQITGLFRSDAPSSIDVWHLSQQFANLPVLGPQFIEDNPPIDRVIAVNTEPHFLLDCYFKLTCARPMPTYGVPGLIDHF